MASLRCSIDSLQNGKMASEPLFMTSLQLESWPHYSWSWPLHLKSWLFCIGLRPLYSWNHALITLGIMAFLLQRMTSFILVYNARNIRYHGAAWTCTMHMISSILLFGADPDRIGLLGRASRHTRFLRSPRANAGMKRNKCGCTQPLFRVGHDQGINKRLKSKGLRQY